jgi:riboflavin synthase
VFTGLVEDVGRVAAVDATTDGARLTLATTLAAQIGAGDSIAVNGVCLTATTVTADEFSADVMHESLRRSSLGALHAGDRVNLELALRADARLGGHIMQGHVDGLARVTDVEDEGFAKVVTVAPEDPGLLRYVVEKGSIAIDGVSLTVARVDDEGFAVSLIPETLQRTNLGNAGPGHPMNLEVDVLAKYVEKAAAYAAGASSLRERRGEEGR